MKTLKCIIVISLLFSTIFSTAKVAKIDHKKLILNSLEQYAEYYSFEDVEISNLHEEKSNNNTEYYVSITAKLKYLSVYDMDYYKGACAAYLDNSKDNSSKDVLSQIYNDLSQNIMEEQKLIFYCEIENGAVLFSDGFEYIDSNEFRPLSHKELYELGYNAYLRELEENKKAKSSRSNYSVSNAVLYATTYTSNPTSCNLHSGCGALVDTTKYNSSYSYYIPNASSHTDCANYMSQALYAGGIPTDTIWYVGSIAWRGVISLTSFMDTNHYWVPSKTSDIAVGYYDVYSGGSHIGMITAFDGVSFRFTAHTNDRKNVVTGIYSTHTYYRVAY